MILPSAQVFSIYLRQLAVQHQLELKFRSQYLIIVSRAHVAENRIIVSPGQGERREQDVD